MKNQGQTLVEFSFCSVLVSLVIVGVGAVVVDAWNRSQCAYFVFEKTHAQLVGRSFPKTSYFIQIVERDNQISGSGKCGVAQERVVLPQLESAQW